MQIVLSDEELKNVQKIELEMLEEIDRICKKVGIRYTLIGGSLLGAVRHGGFIPWDDDSDVAMLREEYNKFAEACKTELDTTRFYFQDMNNTKGYRWGYGKLRRRDTVFLRDGQEHMPYEQGIFVDIFPADSVPNNLFLRKVQKFHCFCLRKVMWSAVGKKTEKKRHIRWWYFILSKIPEEAIKKHINQYVLSCNKKYKDSQLVRTYLFPVRKNVYGYQRKWYLNTEGILFEGMCLQGSKHRKDYLETKFGNDYMTLPPIEKRQCHPVSAIKFVDV